MPRTYVGSAGSDTFTIGGNQPETGNSFRGAGGQDIYKVEDAVDAIILDFGLNDVLDLKPWIEHYISSFPKESGWTGKADFQTGHFRLHQVGADTLVEGFIPGDPGSPNYWATVATLKGVNAAALTAANFGGLTPVITEATYASIHLTSNRIDPVNGTALFLEGGYISGEVRLDQPLTKDASVWLFGRANLSGDGATSTASQVVVIKAGSTSASFKFKAPEDALSAGSYSGDYYVQIYGIDGAVVAGEDPVNKSWWYKGSLLNNDTSSVIISPGSAHDTYLRLTRSTTVDATTDAALKAFDALSSFDMVQKVSDYVRGTTSVAITSYQFFTGKSPSAGGIDYLVSTTAGNPNNLNSAYYAGFNLENRYINFAANLGLSGEGAAGFKAQFGGMSWASAVEAIYDKIIGKAAATAAGINVSAALNSIVGLEGYFRAVATERMPSADTGLAMKAGVAGYIMVEAIKAHVGDYDRALTNFYVDWADGTAQHNVDLVAVYRDWSFN